MLSTQCLTQFFRFVFKKQIILKNLLKIRTVFLIIRKRDRDRRVTVALPSGDQFFQRPRMSAERPPNVNSTSMSIHEHP